MLTLRQNLEDGPVERGADPTGTFVSLDENMTRFVGRDGLPALHLVHRPDPDGTPRLWLCEDASGLLVNVRDRRLPPAGVIAGKLRGVRYYPESVRRGDFSPGSPVTLVPEPSNPHDSQAVAVFDATGTYRAAYLNKQKARICLKRLAAGHVLAAVTTFGTPPGTPAKGVHVVVASPSAIAHLLRRI